MVWEIRGGQSSSSSSSKWFSRAMRTQSSTQALCLRDVLRRVDGREYVHAPSFLILHYITLHLVITVNNAYIIVSIIDFLSSIIHCLLG